MAGPSTPWPGRHNESADVLRPSVGKHAPGSGGVVGQCLRPTRVRPNDAHFEHAQAAGATIVTPIIEHGSRAYTAQDCEGRHWQFMQAGPRIDS